MSDLSPVLLQRSDAVAEKCVLPLAERFATASYRSSNTGPWFA